MKRILVGVDGSTESREAAKWAVDLAQATGARVTVASSVFVPAAMASPELQWRTAAWQAEEREQAGKVTKAIAAEVARDGIEVEPLVLNGPPAETLAELAQAADIDIVVVGHRGRGAIARMLLGSVADRLVQISPKPVLIVR